ncbi:Rieske (2Fe-2S) protein [Paenibacillus mesophilus]|uniref:Rieske (2Fe-2S) protein n=1 Tax=Paenibacillus mesophilus TaxID=2582849 RepID=UPI00110EFD5B|nr:Rieske (2Fe-2S) protein [Paenibacillus mesophilus]TMV45102.1 Rieske (2Fe-2S) protein [Paenibacillus mesophilus]
MTVHYVDEAGQIPEGQHRMYEIDGKSIGVYNVKGEYYAILNYCPHQGAQLCKGPVCGTTLLSPVYEYEYGKQGEIVRCPWHGWEFDIRTGKSLVEGKSRLRRYAVIHENGKIGIEV